MKLRLFVIVLFLANLAVAAWYLGWIDSIVGPEMRTDREPSRVLQQVRPNTVSVVLSAGARAPIAPVGPPANPPPASHNSDGSAPSIGAPSPTSAASAPAAPASGATLVAVGGISVGRCLEAGPFETEAEVAAAEQALAALPASAWQRVGAPRPATFAIVFGPFASDEGLRTKTEELDRMKLAYERTPLRRADGSAVSSGPNVLVVHRAPTRAAADAALANLARRGVRTARVVPWLPAGTRYHVRVPAPSAQQIQWVRAAASGGREFKPCAA